MQVAIVEQFRDHMDNNVSVFAEVSGGSDVIQVVTLRSQAVPLTLKVLTSRDSWLSYLLVSVFRSWVEENLWRGSA